jgi:anion-transporting  ArsA/GET3 family ATPase
MICMDKAEDFSRFLGPEFQQDIDLALNSVRENTQEAVKPVETDPKIERINKLIEGLKTIVPDYDFTSTNLSAATDDELQDLEALLRSPEQFKEKVAEIEKTLNVYRGIERALLFSPESKANYRLSQIRSALPTLTEEEVNLVSNYFDSISIRAESAIRNSINNASITNFTIKPLSEEVQKLVETATEGFGIRITKKDIDYATTTTKAFEIGRTNIPSNFFEEGTEELNRIKDKALTSGGPFSRWYRRIEEIFNQADDSVRTAMTATLELGKVYSEVSTSIPSDTIKSLQTIIENAQRKLGELFKTKTQYEASTSQLEGMLTESDDEAKAILLITKDTEILEKVKQAFHRVMNVSAAPILVKRLEKELEETNGISAGLPNTLRSKLDKLKKTPETEVKIEKEMTIEEINAAIGRVMAYFGNFDTTIYAPIPEEINTDIIRLSTTRQKEGEINIGGFANTFRIMMSKIRDAVPVDPRTVQTAPSIKQEEIGEITQTLPTMKNEAPELSEIIQENQIIAPNEVNGEYEFDLQGFKLSAKKEGSKYIVRTIQRDSGVSFSNIQTTLSSELSLLPFLQTSREGVLMEPFDQILRRDKPMNFFLITIDGKPHLLKVISPQDSSKLTKLVQSNRDNIEALLSIIKSALNIPA